MATIHNIDVLADSAMVTSVTSASHQMRRSRNCRRASLGAMRRSPSTRLMLPDRKDLPKVITTAAVFQRAKLDNGQFDGAILSEAGELAFRSNLGSVIINGDLKLVGDLVVASGTSVEVLGEIHTTDGIIHGRGSIKAKSVTAIAMRLEGDLISDERIDASREISVGGSVTVGNADMEDIGYISAGRSVFIGGDLRAPHSGIYLQNGGLEIGGDANVGFSIVTQHDVIVGGSLRCDGVKAEWSIAVGRSIEVAKNIIAGQTITVAKDISAGWRIMAGVQEYDAPTRENSLIKCHSIKSGTVACGELELTA